MIEDFTQEGISNKELILEIRKAIRAIAIGGQSYKIGSRSLTRANLTELRHALTELEAQEASAEDGGLFGNTSVAVFEGR